MIRIHGPIQIPTTQVSQIKGLAVGLVRRYRYDRRLTRGYTEGSFALQVGISINQN